MRRIAFLIPVCLFFASCHNSPGTSTANSAAGTLTEENLLEQEAVRTYLQAHSQQDARGDALFMQAIDAYRNKKEVSAAMKLFTRSILQHPTAKAYYEYGNASMDAKNYELAIKAFRIGEQLGFEPVSRLLYNEACAYSRMGKGKEAVKYLEYAVEGGYTNADQIMKDPDLTSARKAETFQAVYQDAMSGNQDPAVVSWLSFKRGFPQASLPLTLNKETSKRINTESFISYDFEKFVPEMQGERFSREVGKEFYYLAKISDTHQYTAIIYVIKNVMMGNNAPFAYMLASFDRKGTLIDKMITGGQREPGDPYVVSTIRQNQEWDRLEYKQTYEHNPAESGYIDNKVVSLRLMNTRHYKLTEDGHIAESGAMVGMR